MALLRAVFLSCFFGMATLQAQLAGEWFAVLDAMGTKLPMKLELRQTADTWAGEMSDPTVPGRRIDLAEIDYDGQQFSYTVPTLGIVFSGTQDGEELRGVFRQANTDFPLVFTRQRPVGYPSADAPSRPQEPQDFPYLRQSVTFAGGADSVTLAGELTLPASDRPKAALVLVSGSGPQDRNSALGPPINHRPFLVLSDFLTRRGYAVLRYDDRGVGESTGSFSSATSADLAADAGAALRFLREQPALAGVPVGMAGHSEGGMIAPMVAVADGKMDFMVLLAAPGVAIDSLMLEQRRLVSKAMGVPEAITLRDEPLIRAAYRWIGENTQLDQATYVEGLSRQIEAQLDHLPEPVRQSIVDPKAYSAQYVRPLSSPWMRYFLAFQPRDYLRQLTMPLLAINGTKDTQVPDLANLHAIAEAMAYSGNKDATVLALPNLNHLFQPADSGAPTEYGSIEITFDPVALEAIADWLDARFE
ncbi:alpha/beta hydrolase [Neolewinella lacunae]|uniref:Alpha/beta hydrolase n=1 Tax=Neolewinella lacunae TaxID=1517758 RepID=A0A923PTZ9_9BACT|nr:alpha/beta hydrolase [Neolewinella lacunae]MBC6996787.1 alpha/beta hydrolase [Neolewinella lacunae]MDN3637015.1 alpha/beta hydrolase [Neolewinella lacunae]